ncbi:hypothetical protein [Paenarthrobacter sp. NPDC057981]|uniref:hypothetical protein n=1 Tax=Paenarthrobacter sp. NPDC057981 TaxID=3346297 RepID=UPI0036D7B08A
MSNEARKNAALRTLSKSVLRARLVQEHSLAADKQLLAKHAAWTLSFNMIVSPVTGAKSVGRRTLTIGRAGPVQLDRRP